MECCYTKILKEKQYYGLYYIQSRKKFIETIERNQEKWRILKGLRVNIHSRIDTTSGIGSYPIFPLN